MDEFQAKQAALETKFNLAYNNREATRQVVEEFCAAYEERLEADCPLATLEPLMRIAREAIQAGDLGLLAIVHQAFNEGKSRYSFMVLLTRVADAIPVLVQMHDMLPEQYHESFVYMCHFLMDMDDEGYPALAAYFRPLYEAIGVHDDEYDETSQPATTLEDDIQALYDEYGIP
jgi:hypothetical protein